jgi:hypothetical protein
MTHHDDALAERDEQIARLEADLRMVRATLAAITGEKAMSGGSFDYLCDLSAEEMLTERHRTLMRRMAAALTEAGAGDAALETEALVLAVEHALRQIEARRRRLDRVWHAIEWWKSGDWSEDQFRAALAAYREGS